MSDELDKFVLQYTVEMKDAIKRLEDLNSKVKDVKGNSEKSGKELQNFAKDSTAEVSKLVPCMEGVSKAIGMIGTEAALAGIAIGALAIGIKSVIDMREQYNEQRKQGMEMGMSALRLEEYQRKFVKASGGNITREDTAAELKKLADFSTAVFTDPTRIGTEARTARVLGVDMKSPGEHTSVNELMVQLGNKFDKMTDVQVQAFAKTMGMNQDFALGLKKQGGSVGNITELSKSEIEHRESAQKSLEEYNAATAKLEEQYAEMKNTLGESLIPALTEFIKDLNDLIGWFRKFNAEQNEKFHKLSDSQEKKNIRVDKAKDDASHGDMRGMDSLRKESQDKAYKDSGWYQLKTWWQNRNKPAEVPVTGSTATPANPDAPKTEDAKQRAATEQAKKQDEAAKKLKDMVDGTSENNAKARQIADQQQLAINQFAGAVASFANAIDEKQAWAAWAGEIGKASGLGSGKNMDKDAPEMQRPPDSTNVGPDTADRRGNTQSGSGLPQMRKTQYDDLFEAAGKKYNVDPQMLKNIARVESGFNKDIVSNKGATGLMQIMPGNWKSLGITDAKDPTQNVMGGANLFSQFLKKANGDQELALRYYNGGFDRSKWGAQNSAYAGKVLGTGATAVGGESRDKMNYRSVQATIAGRLGVPLQQLQLGGVNRGDVSFASSQLEAGIQNQIFDLKNQLKAVNLPQQTRSKLMTELRDQQSGLEMMRQYSSQVADKSQDGGRSITIGERAIVINVNGAQDPKVTAQHVQNALNDHLAEVVNGTATNIKY